MGTASDSNSQAVIGQAWFTGGRPYEAAFEDTDHHADAFRCLARPSDCRVRDLRTPWEARRYLMPDGTLSASPVPGVPR
jgi:hypothetical protein